LLDRPIGGVTLLGSPGVVQWTQTADALTIQAPKPAPNDIAVVYKITPQ
jgi:hypothetical protein